MAKTALAVLESALRARQLDRTLTTALPSLERTDPAALLATEITPLDACLRGGLPRGQLSEIAGPRSSGRMTLLLQLVAAAARRGEIAAFVDTFDRFDVASACAAGVDLDRLLWIRGEQPSSMFDRTLERALKALNLVLQAGGFGVVAIDLADAPLLALKRLPYTTWLRVQRIVEGSDTACVLLTPEPLARSAGGVTLALGAAGQWTGAADRSRRFAGLDVTARVISPRRRVEGDVRLAATAVNDSADHDTPRIRGTENVMVTASVPQCLGVSASV
jgi:recombination protein RecA